MLVCSNKGKHRVGVLVGCVRKLLMGWSVAAACAEFGRYAGEKGEADLEVRSSGEGDAGEDGGLICGWGGFSLSSCLIRSSRLTGAMRQIG